MCKAFDWGDFGRSVKRGTITVNNSIGTELGKLRLGKGAICCRTRCTS